MIIQEEEEDDQCVFKCDRCGKEVIIFVSDWDLMEAHMTGYNGESYCGDYVFQRYLTD